MSMKQPKWLSEWGMSRSLLDCSISVDLTEIKVIEGTYKQSLFFIAIGTLPKVKEHSEEGKAEQNTKGSNLNFKWKIFYDLSTLPKTLTLERAKNMMADIIALVSENNSVYDIQTKYIASGVKPAKGNAPLLLDYELAKTIQNAKRQKTGMPSAPARYGQSGQN